MVSTGRPARLGPGEAVHYPVTAPGPGEGWAVLTLDAPGTSWHRGEAAVVALTVDGARRQEIVLAAGDEPVPYLRALGALAGGSHVLRLELDAALSAPSARDVWVRGVQVGVVPDSDPVARVWRHAPILHYTTLDGPLDARTTDTPLLLFYRPVSGHGGEGVEYHVIYSHEDEGTDLTGLLARWGHTTDIEWVYRVVWDRRGAVVREEIQGSAHEAVPFQGDRDLGVHPVLQVATRNGLVSHLVACPYRTALAPALSQPLGEPREGVQDRFPWIYRVSALEVLRQARLEAVPVPESPFPADPRVYLYVEWARISGPVLPLEAQARVHGQWYGSAWGRRELAFDEPDAESTAVKLPPGTTEGEVEAIALRTFAPPSEGAEVRFVRAFLLDGDYRPRPPLAKGGVCRLGPARLWETVWTRGS